MKLNLKKFDPSRIEATNVLVFLGKRNTGKSFLVRDMLYYNRDIPTGVVISPTEAANRFYSNMVPSLFIHDEYTPDLVQSITKRQIKVMKKTKINKKIDPRTFLILDDCLYDGCWKKDKNIRYLFFNGRHIKVFLLITMQYPLGIPPELRTNVDFCFILRENNYNNRKRIYENYCSIFPTFEIFCQVMDKITEDYGCLVIDNTTKSNRLEDNVFWYCADDHPDYKLGTKQMWEMSREAESKKNNEDEDEEFFDMNNYNQKKGKNIDVTKLY